MGSNKKAKKKNIITIVTIISEKKKKKNGLEETAIFVYRTMNTHSVICHLILGQLTT